MDATWCNLKGTLGWRNPSSIDLYLGIYWLNRKLTQVVGFLKVEDGATTVDDSGSDMKAALLQRLGGPLCSPSSTLVAAGKHLAKAS